MAVDSTATFISQKISKIRWKPDPKQIVDRPEYFITGSWDNGVSIYESLRSRSLAARCHS